MTEFMQYSEEWKEEIKKLPKNTIVEIASQIGIEKQKEINQLKGAVERLEFMIKNGLGESDMRNDVSEMHEI